MDKPGAFASMYRDQEQPQSGPSWGDVRDAAPGAAANAAYAFSPNGALSDVVRAGINADPLGLGIAAAGAFIPAAKLGKKAIDAGLDMSHAARMARAKEMGFDVNNPLYVSSLQDTESFKPHGGFMGHKGISGISLTDNPDMANRYLERFGDFDYRQQPFNKNVMKVYIRPGEVLDRSKPFYPETTQTGFPLPRDYSWPKNLDGVDTVRFPDSITKYGDVAHSNEHSGRELLSGMEYILRDPSRIRSINAAFDPAKKDSANLLDSLLPGTVVGGSAYGAFAPSQDKRDY